MNENMTMEEQAAFLFETAWPGVSWNDPLVASGPGGTTRYAESDKRLFRDHAASLALYRTTTGNAVR